MPAGHLAQLYRGLWIQSTPEGLYPSKHQDCRNSQRGMSPRVTLVVDLEQSK